VQDADSIYMFKNTGQRRFEEVSKYRYLLIDARYMFVSIAAGTNLGSRHKARSLVRWHGILTVNSL
jgi:hypothetical protein